MTSPHRIRLSFTVWGALALASASIAPHASAAQTVWRCDGNSYSAQPCSGGRLLDAADARTAAEQHAARDVVERERRLAREMTQDRRDRERELRQTMGNGVTGFGSHAAATSAALKPMDRVAREPKKAAAKHLRKAKAPKPMSTPSAAGT